MYICNVCTLYVYTCVCICACMHVFVYLSIMKIWYLSIYLG